jgi:hypothetical protein
MTYDGHMASRLGYLFKDRHHPGLQIGKGLSLRRPEPGQVPAPLLKGPWIAFFYLLKGQAFPLPEIYFPQPVIWLRPQLVRLGQDLCGPHSPFQVAADDARQLRSGQPPGQGPGLGPAQFVQGDIYLADEAPGLVLTGLGVP